MHRTILSRILALSFTVLVGCRPDGPPEIDLVQGQLGESFTAVDIGAVGATGSYTAAAGTHTLEGAGADIWAGTDAFRFAHQPLSGDGTIIARVVSLENTNGFAKAGVMMRESTGATARNVFALVTPTIANGFRFQSRATTGGTTDRSFSGSGTAPHWLRLVRAGNTFTASHSTDGSSWVAIGPAVTVTMGSTVLVGLAVTSHAAGNLATAVFDSVSITTPAPPPPPVAPDKPAGLTAAAGNGQVALSWSAVSGATGYTVKKGPSLAGPFSAFQSVTSPAFVNTGLTNGTTYFYAVSAVNAAGESDNSDAAQATPIAPPPATFATQDIGNVVLAGSWGEASGTHTIKGAGGDIYGKADAFRFAYQTINGDVTITARVQSLTATNTWTKAVVMIREDLTAGSRNVAAVVSPTAANKYRLQVRTAAGVDTTSASGATSALPSWLRLERIGSSFKAFTSTTGSGWTQLGATTTVAMNGTVRVGLGVTSHTTTALATGVFTDVTITTPIPPGPPPPVAGSKIEVGSPELIFSAVRGTRSVVRTLVVRNVGDAPLQLAAPAIQGPSASIFQFDGAAPGPVTVAPGSQTLVKVAFAPLTTTMLYVHQAALRLLSSDPDQPTVDVGLWGMATQGLSGGNEPPLDACVDTLGYAIDVGGTSLIIGTGSAPVGDEVLAPRFQRASPGPITMRPVARFSPDEAVPFGLYLGTGATLVKQQLGVIQAGQYQTLLPEVVAGSPLSADPGDVTFGLFTTTSAHSTFTEDALNTGTVIHAVRTYPLKNRAGQPVPNSYLVGFEEAANGDYQDFVFVLENVVPVP